MTFKLSVATGGGKKPGLKRPEQPTVTSLPPPPCEHWWLRGICSGGEDKPKATALPQGSGHCLMAQSCPALCDPMGSSNQVSLSFTVSWSLLKLMSIESMMPSNHLILYHPHLLCPQSFPASASFTMSWLFVSGGQSIGASASASVLPMNIQG